MNAYIVVLTDGRSLAVTGMELSGRWNERDGMIFTTEDGASAFYSDRMILSIDGETR